MSCFSKISCYKLFENCTYYLCKKLFWIPTCGSRKIKMDLDFQLTKQQPWLILWNSQSIRGVKGLGKKREGGEDTIILCASWGFKRENRSLLTLETFPTTSKLFYCGVGSWNSDQCHMTFRNYLIVGLKNFSVTWMLPWTQFNVCTVLILAV